MTREEIKYRNMTEFHKVVHDIIDKKIFPVAIWSEHTYTQRCDGLYHTTKWGNKEDEELFDKVWQTLHDYAVERGVKDIYFNHIVYEFIQSCGDIIFVGLNDCRLSISDKMATIDGKRYKI